MIMKKLRTIYIILIVIICISVMFVNAREPLNDDINVDVTVKSKVPTTTYTTTTTGDGSTTFLGCYEDKSQTGSPGRMLKPDSHPVTSGDGGEGAFNGHFWKFPTTLTKEKCAEQCNSLGYKFMGLQYAFECFCSNTFNSAAYSRTSGHEGGHVEKKRKKRQWGCLSKCSGDKKQYCGGSWRQQVYELTPTITVETSTTTNENADTTQLNTLSLYEKNEDNMYSDISSLNFTNTNVNATNNYTNNSAFTLSLNDLNEDGVQNISRANIGIGDDDLDIDNAYIDISSNNGTCITSGNYTIGSTYMDANSSTNIDFGTPLSINDSCNANAPGAQSLNIS